MAKASSSKKTLGGLKVAGRVLDDHGRAVEELVVSCVDPADGERAIAEAGATGAKDMGKVIAAVKPKVAGRTDMGKLSELVKQKLAALG